MYQIGDTVMHPSEGVCTVEDVRPIRFSGNSERMYYILRPAMEKASSTVYLPIERGDAILRRLLSKPDILNMIHESASYAGLWLDDSRARKERFTAILHEGNYAKLIRMICEIHEHYAPKLAEGKKMAATDENLLSSAQRLVHQEFSYVLNLRPEDTVQFILKELHVQ